MAGINSILFLLTTLSPFADPPEDVTAPYQWNTKWYPTSPEFSRALACGPELVFVYCHYDLQPNCTNFEEITRYNRDEIYNVDPSGAYKCISGCVCVEPKIKGLDGRCIFPEECPNAKSDWKIRPDPESDESSLPPDDYPFTEDLEDNTVTDSGDPNFLPEEHSATQKQSFMCQRNEVWSICPSVCPDNCNNYEDKRRSCKKICLPLPRCDCKSGFIRSPYGNCIKPDQCPRHEKETCPENEKYTTCGSACPKTCDNYNKNIACPAVCAPGCFCEEPMVRGPNGKCVLIDECPESDNNGIVDFSMFPGFFCKVNEEFSPFTSLCPDNCDNYQYPHRACNYIRIPGCRCKEGYVRGRDGVCIRTEQCEEHVETCPENEEYTTCGSACPNTCDNYDKTKPCPAICVPGCFCQQPMIRGPGGKCVSADECPRNDNRTCPENEHYTTCGSRCPKTCDNYNKNIACPAVCVPGCFCEESMVRGPHGKCILIDECPENDENTCPENEEYNTCGSTCPKTCDNYDKTVICPAVCVTGCFCQEPMVRGPDGNCILIDECPGNDEETCPENEQYTTCGSACTQTCDNYNETIVCPEVCVPGCFCEEPMIRGPDGKCILVDECPGNDEGTCPENEQYTTCGSACPKTCDNYDKIIPCPDVCVAGCFCEEPMVRGPDGKCVLIEECPGSDKGNNGIVDSSILPNLLCKEHEEFSPFTSLCPDNCDNYENKHRSCHNIRIPGCRCKEGYIRERGGTCVRSEQCEERQPEDCTENEYFDVCGSYCETDCVDFRRNRHLTKCKDQRCKRGCFCKGGSVRGPNWECVAPYGCPAVDIPKLF